ncbi:MAG: hypothetical protein IPM11_01395 [Micropruina sp.]|nr:hypothetical protein [Micropruina sp.]
MRRFLRPFFVVLALIAGGLTATVATAAPGIPIYRAHVQNVGWLPNTEPTLVGDIAGLPGSGLRVEALQVSRDIQLQAHVQNVGWMAPVAPDGIAGTTGRSLRLEAVKATSMVAGYHVECEAIVPGAGTIRVGDGGVCGTTGRSLLVEAFRLRLVADGATEPTASPRSSPGYVDPDPDRYSSGHAPRVRLGADRFHGRHRLRREQWQWRHYWRLQGHRCRGAGLRRDHR